MVCYSKAAMERTMKIQDVLLRAMARKITGSRRPRFWALPIGICVGFGNVGVWL